MTNEELYQMDLDLARNSLDSVEKYVPVPNPMAALYAIDISSHAVERITRYLVRLAREDGATWQQIADALSLTRQSAWARYSGRLHS